MHNQGLFKPFFVVFNKCPPRPFLSVLARFHVWQYYRIGCLKIKSAETEYWRGFPACIKNKQHFKKCANSDCLKNRQPKTLL
jgi:hypothetical protein